MRFAPSPSTVRVRSFAGLVAAFLLATPTSASAQARSTAPADAAELVDEARERQREFERFRESRIPVERERTEQGCDEQIGRICIWFGGEGEARFPRELPEVGNARVELIRFLSDVADQVDDRWVIGQWVHYLTENRNFDEAERVATECGIAETWWCSALRGYALHVRSEYVEAEAAFREALSTMPEEERQRWIAPRYIFTPDGEDDFGRADPEERDRLWELFWRLSDPLFLIEGNDRLTDHLARWVEATNRRDSEHPQGLQWEEDVEATLIRYGRIIGYSRTHDPMNTLNRGRMQDTRRVVGHHHPQSRGYLFPEAFLESPSDIPPESWITAPREARTWYAPPYAPDIRGMETQVGRFRRGEEMLVVGAYRPIAPDSVEPSAAWSPEDGLLGPVHAAFFLIPEDGSEANFVRSADPEGVFTLHSWPGRYVSGLEVVDLQGRQAWRARQGVVQLPLAPGLVDVSDLLILKEGAPSPESLDDAIPHVRPGVRIRRGERFPVVWEAYGLRILEPVRVTLGFTRGHPGFLTRVGEFLGVIEPDRPVEVTFEDTGPDVVQTAFRTIELELPDLEPGEYTLHLRLDLVGRTPVVRSRPILVVE
jgi:hypothetical protein